MPTSRRNYLTESELEEFADITVTDEDEGLDQISQAEEIIDSFIGPQDKFLKETIVGKASGGSATSLTLDSVVVNNYPYTDFFVGCMVEIIGGTGVGQRVRCTASSVAGVLTTETFSTPPDTTSAYRIWQVGKFPRYHDVFYNTNETPAKYYKAIPEAVKRAVAAQVQFVIEMGEKYFSTNQAAYKSESIGDYSYTKADLASDSPLIAPKAKILLRGIINRTGQIEE